MKRARRNRRAGCRPFDSRNTLTEFIEFRFLDNTDSLCCAVMDKGLLSKAIESGYRVRDGRLCGEPGTIAVRTVNSFGPVSGDVQYYCHRHFNSGTGQKFGLSAQYVRSRGTVVLQEGDE